MLTIKQKDISILLDIRSFIMSVDQSPTLIKRLAQIGNLLHSIAWNENDSDCIRNKHGFRNRHKDMGNKVNNTGAKLDFEILAYCTKLAEDQEMHSLLLKNELAIEDSLLTLKTKIDFIITTEFNFLTEEQRAEISLNPEKLSVSEDSDLGFLWRIAAYHHDQHCLKQLLILLTTFDGMVNEDLNGPIQRYNLGYIFCQLGENAKEISDFVKPESYKKPEENVTRFMFGKLGHYRQVIKQDPFIVRKGNTQKLRQMRLLMSRVSLILKPLLIDLQNRLKEFETQEKLNDYADCNLPDSATKKSAFEIKWSEELKKLTQLLTLGITFWKDLIQKRSRYIDEIAKLSAQKQQLEEIQQQLEEIQQQPSVHILTDNTYSSNNDIEPIRVILNKNELLDYLDTPVSSLRQLSEQSDLAFNPKLKGLIITIFKKLQKKSTQQHLIERYELKQKSISAFSLKELKDALEKKAINETHAAKPLESNHAQKLHALKRQISEKENDLLQVDKNIKFLETNLQLQPSAQTTQSVKHIKNLFSYIFDEISLIESFYHSGEAVSSNAVKMAMGWIGHYSKEIKKDSDTTTNLKKYTHALIEICFKKAEYVRSKIIMHDMANGNSLVLEQTWSEFILPTKDDIHALSIIHEERDQSPSLLLARAFMRLDEHAQAVSVLEDHLANLKAGRVQAEILVNLADYEPHAAPLLSIVQNLRQVSRDRFGLSEEAIKTVENQVHYSLEYSKTLMLMAKCYQHRESVEDLQKGLRFIDEALQVIAQQLSILRQPTRISNPSILQPSYDAKFDEWLFCQSVKSFFLIKLNQNNEAQEILFELEKKFDQSTIIQSKFATRIIRILTDLATITEDIDLQKSYIEKAQRHLTRSDRKTFSGYLIQLRHYELAYQCFSKEQNPRNFDYFRQRVIALHSFFEKNRSNLQQENSLKIFEYEGNVLMANLELKFTNIKEYAEDIFELFKKWDSIEKHINYAAKLKCYALKFIYFSRRGMDAFFKHCLEKFIIVGAENDPDNFRSELLIMLNALIRWNLASFILTGIDFIERKFTTLTQAECISKEIALDMLHKKTPVLASCHLIVQEGISAIAAQLNRITEKLCPETWGHTNSAVVLISSTAPLENIKNYLGPWEIGNIKVTRGELQNSISISNFTGKNISDIPPMTQIVSNITELRI